MPKGIAGSSPVCVVDGCSRLHKGHGFCRMHWERWKKHGDPLYVPPVRSMEERFWAKVDRTGECWVWTASLTAGGYGQFVEGGKHLVPHRLAYEWLVGPIPDGLTLDHLCRNRRCVNPAHLEPVTMRENLRRGISPSALNALKTHCPKGHPYDAENTLWISGSRKCRICNREHCREYTPKRAAKRIEARVAALERRLSA